MTKRKSLSSELHGELVAELDRKLAELQKGRGDWNEFWQWWDEHFAIKGKGILKDLLRRRELARGWNSRPKGPRKKSS